jgi:serine/threonine protein kinase
VKNIGTYEIIEKIGEGSYGIVYKARATEGPLEGTMVALKRLRGAILDPVARERVEREAATLQSFKHPNIVRCLDFFEHKGDDDAAVCLVLEYIDGRSLDALIEDHRKGLPVSQALDIMAQTANGLAYSTAHGVIHRDIKPSNIMICHDGTAKVLDYGVARGIEGTLSTIGEYRGSLDYMAPDYARIERFTADEQSDIFSFGITFLETLTGTHPYKRYAATEQEAYVTFFKWAQSVTEEAILPSHPVFRDAALAAFLRRCISPDRDRRFREFCGLLEEADKLKGTYVRGESGDEYRIVKPLGQGAFGSVHLAERLRDCTHVAVKKLGRIHARERFLREVQVLKSIEHPNIVDYVDHYCVHAQGENAAGEYGLVMEYLDGPTLLERIREHPKGMPPKETVRLFVGYAAALKYCQQHAAILCHRDLKPGNLFAAPTQKPKVFDFGITRQEGSMTEGHVPGTLDYMAPDFADQDRAGFRGDLQSDLYSFGICLYEALTGELPFPRFSRDMTTALQQFFERAKCPEKKIPFQHPVFSASPELRQIIEKLIARARDGRYAEAAALKKDLAYLYDAMPPDEPEALESSDVPPTMDGAVSAPPRRPPGTMTFDPDAMAAKDQEATPESPGRGSALRSWGRKANTCLRRTPRAVKVAAPLLLLGVLAVGLGRSCRTARTDDLHEEAKQAVVAEDWATARSLCEQGAKEAPGDNRFQELLGDIPALSTISVETVPTGATVRFRGKDLGVAPLVATNLVAGSGTLEIHAADRVSVSREIQLNGGQSTNIVVSLLKPFGILNVASAPAGAAVWVNGDKQDGVTPLSVTSCPSGSIEITVRKEGFRAASKELRLEPEDVLEVAFPDLIAETGTLTVESTPPGAKVLIDNVERGTTPATIAGIPVGDRTLHIELPHHEVARREFSLADEELKLEQAILTPLPATVEVVSEPAGATILLDGQPLDKTTPATVTVKPNVHHRIALRKDRYEEAEEKIVNPEPESTATLNFKLRRLTGDLRLTGLVKGAVITVGGVEVGTAGTESYDISGLPVGRHRILVTKEGYRPIAPADITIRDRDTAIHNVTMLPQGATLTITPVLPADYKGEAKAEIRLDGMSKGEHVLPHTLIGLDPGQHIVHLTGRKWAISDAPSKVFLGKNQDATLDYELTPAHCSIDLMVKPDNATITVDRKPARAGEILLTPDEPHILRVEAPGYVPHVQEIRLGPNQGKWIEVKLKRQW